MVRLKWMPNTWPENLTGFSIKRRTEGAADWQSIHEDLIVPELDPNKPLVNVEPSSSEALRLKQKLNELINVGRASVISRDEYDQEVLNTPYRIENLKLAFLIDYDFALLNGFGLIDRDIPGDGIYEYGLFPKYESELPSDDPISTFVWEYGEMPEASMDMEAGIRKRRNQTTVRWKVDTDEFISKGLAGFNIYKKTGDGDFKKVNSTLRLISVVNNPEYIVFVDDEAQEGSVSYAAVPVTPFGTEGSRVEIAYHPKNVAIFIAPPRLSHQQESENLSGVSLLWDFDAEHEQYIEGFQLERRASNQIDFTPIAVDLDPNSRSFHDNQLDKSGMYHYRLIVRRSIPSTIFSNELSFFYNHSLIPESPTSLIGRYVEDGANGHVELTWDSGPGLNAYVIYYSKPGERYISQDTRVGVIRQTNHQIDPGQYQRGEWRFAVASVSATGEQSERSKEVRVMVPNRTLPTIVNKSAELVDSTRVRVTWTYADDIDDLKGFRIRQNDEIIANEDQLGKQTREWLSPQLEPGEKYIFQIQAVSDFGVVSEGAYKQIDM